MRTTDLRNPVAHAPTDAASVRLGAEHGTPLPESLSVLATKRALFAVDSYFRDSWEDLCELPAETVELILRHHALLLLKPDAVVGRRLTAALDWLRGQGTVVAAEPVRLDRHTARAMWQYQWNAASRDRRDLADLICHDGGESLVLIVRMPADHRPATVRLSAAKGPADPERREPWQLRHRLGNENFLLNFVHAADEPADLVREIGVLFDAPRRRGLYRRLRDGADATGAARAAVERLYARTPARDLGLAALISRQDRRLDGRDGPTPRELTAALEATEAGLNADWRGLCDLSERAGVPLDPWDRVVLGTHLMVASDAGTVPILAGVPVREWDRRPDPAILPPGWSPRGVRTALPGSRPARPAESPELRYDQPVAHALVHKAGVGEVLVTDSAPVSERVFAVAGELPRTHCYFSDLPAAADRYDAVALLEFCRQASYVVIHRYLGVPVDRSFLLRRIGVALTPGVVFADQPDLLRLRASVTVERRFDAPVPGLSVRLDLTAPDGRELGRGALSASWLTAGEYARLRREARAARGLGARPGPPPAVPAERATAASVGRTAPRNVVLADGVDGTGELVVDPTYRGMFDHPQDHLPGMLLVEAARQAALRAVAEGLGGPVGGLALRALRASFPGFAELDLPVRHHTADAPGGADGTQVRVSARQDRTEVCRVTATVAVDPAVGERR
ncbi:hypothetical protein HC031_30655 [Planosporangium thailandense]|uniref:Nucleoside-diphosphate kinase n=1 Tax=Planosporangium thailandense TaxID=765197 RepID=A0ABX0Y6K9_9ACTN|nr:AfsA-related hotdog domain-containing protein [Planosporangium thailandense]NJC74042.1 hypothetical protein [Planosporangium thailandense]